MATHYTDQPQPVDSIEEEINRFFDRIVECVDYRRRALIAEAREKREEKRARLVRKQESERQLLKSKAETEQNLKENLLRSIQEGILATLEEKLSEVRLQEAETRLVFQGDSGQLEEIILGLGEVIEQEIPAIPRNQVPAIPRYQDSVIPRYQDFKVTVAEGRKEWKEWDQELSGFRDIAIDETNYNFFKENAIYITHRSGVLTRIVLDIGEFGGEIGHRHLRDARGIAKHEKYVYVTDWHTNMVYQINEDNFFKIDQANSVGGEGSKDGKFRGPTQVCVSTSGDVYVADYGNNRIQILNSSLHFLRSISHSSMSYPHDIKLTETEIYVLSDDDSPCIHIFSHAGEKIRSLITRGRGEQVTLAYYFCLDANKNIIISDWGAHCVKVFSNEGTLLHTISEHGNEKGMLEFPQGIALTEDLKLIVVSENENFEFQIFSA